MSSSTLAARKQPRQDRSRATVDAIIEAAVELLEQEGYERLTDSQWLARISTEGDPERPAWTASFMP